MGLRKADILAQVQDADWKNSVRLFVDGDVLAAHTRTGNVVLADANGTLPSQDGRTPVDGDEVILDYSAPNSNTGVYVIDTIGSAGTKFQFTRRDDFDEDDNVTEGIRVPIVDGDLFGGRVTKLVTVGVIVINTTPIDFEVDFEVEPLVFTEVNQDDSAVSLAFGTFWIVDNDGASPATDADLNLPAINIADKGKVLEVHTRYTNDPFDTANFGHAVLKRAGSDVIATGGADLTSLDLVDNDEDLALRHDGVSKWYLG